MVWRPFVSILMTSPFSDSIVFSVHTTKQRFQKASFSNRSTRSGERFRMAPFSVIVFGVVVWTIAVSGAKQLRFRLKTDQCGWGLRGPMQFIFFSELTCYSSNTVCYHSSACYADHKDLTQNTVAMIRPPNKRFNEQNNSCARAL